MFIINYYKVVTVCIVDSSLIANWLLVLLTSVDLWLELSVVVQPVCYVKYSTEKINMKNSHKHNYIYIYVPL
jgi:hypothetical protein